MNNRKEKIEENSENNNLKYDAFISYRHCEHDQFVAVMLQKKLEKFKLPKSVMSKVAGDKTKITRVFRDEDELLLSDNLSEPIDQALFNSEFLIVICTPRLSQSRWCLREVETFLKTHDRKHILLVLAEGEPDESFPELLKYEEFEVVDDAGNTHIERRDLEPLAADVRGDNKKEINKSIDNAIIKLAATMFDLNYDDLRQRHREDRLKKIFALWSVITATISIFALVCLVFLTVIINQQKDIKDRYAGTIADAAQGLLEDGRRMEAIYALRSVLDIHEPYNPDAYRQMIKALDLYALGEEYIPGQLFSIPSLIAKYRLSNNNHYIAVSGLNGDCHIINTDENKNIYSFEVSRDGFTFSDYGFDGENGIIYTIDDSVIYADLKDKSEKKLYEANATVISDANCDIISILMADKFVGYKNGKLVYETNLLPYELGFDGVDCLGYSYSPDGMHVLLLMTDEEDSWLLQFNTETGKVEYSLQTNVNLFSSYATDGRRIYIVRNNYLGDRMPVDSSLGIIDIYNPYAIKTVTIPLVHTKDIVLCDAGICISTYNSAIMLDENDYSIKYKTEGISNIISVFRYKTGIGIVDVNGSFYVFDDDLYMEGIDMTADLFGMVPRSTVNHVIFQNDKFYYCFADSYIVEYADNPKAVKKTEEYRKFDYYDDLYLGVTAEEALDNISDIDSAYVYSSFYSNDRRYIAIAMCDKTLRIYDADTYELEKIEYGFDNAFLISFVYVEEADIYILNTITYSYILDSDFNYISDIEYCVGFEDGCFIVYYHEEYYKLKMLSFEEILQLADEELKGYVPDEAMLNKYIVKYNVKKQK